MTERIEILIVDDASGAKAARELAEAIARAAVPFLRCITLPRHGGAGEARNAGFAESRGQVVAFLDDDLVPSDTYLLDTIGAHERHAGALVINGDIGTLRDDVYARFWLSRYGSVFNGPGASFRRIFALSSGHFSVKRALASRVSPLFDPSLTSREDLDLFLRLEQAGVPVFKSDRVSALNDPRRSLWSLVRQHAWYGRGEYALRRKHTAERIEAAQRRARTGEARPFPLIDLTLGLAFHAALRWEAFRRERDPRALVRGAARLLRAPGRLYRRWTAAKDPR